MNVDVDLLALREDVSAVTVRFKKGDGDSNYQLDYLGVTHYHHSNRQRWGR